MGLVGMTHAKAKAKAKSDRNRGYGAFIKKSGDKWYVYRTEDKIR